MSANDMPVADTFEWQHSIYGACEPMSKTLLFILEARDIEVASARVELVAPFFGVKVGRQLELVQLAKLPSGVPTFLNAFFDAGNLAFDRGNVVPGPTTLQ
jgi:hypothetical protein